MGLLRRAAHSVFGDRVPTVEELTLRRQAKQLRRLAKWANRLSRDTAGTRMLNQQALQMALAYEVIREQRYRRLVTIYSAKKCGQCKVTRYQHRADCCAAVISQLQQQLQSYQPQLQQPYPALPPPAYTTQYITPSATIAALPITTQPLPTAYQPLTAPPPYTAMFAHYPTLSALDSSASSPASRSASSVSYASVSSAASDRSQLQEPWLGSVDKRTVY